MAGFTGAPLGRDVEWPFGPIHPEQYTASRVTCQTSDGRRSPGIRERPAWLCIWLAILWLCGFTPNSRAAEEPPADLAATLASAGPLSVGPVSISSREVGQYEKLEATFSVSGTWTNPFAPDQVSVDAVFTSPSGKKIRTPGFFYQDYSRSLRDGAEWLQRVGDPVWKVRFAPVEIGDYRWELLVKNGAQSLIRPGPRFRSVPSDSRGFVRVAPSAGYLETDRGDFWFGIGENVCWAGPKGTYDYDRWYGDLAEQGANYSRLWTEPFTCFTLEQYNPLRPDAGIGKYLQDDAWRLDYVTSLAERDGIRQMLTLDSYNVLRHDLYSPAWQQNAYAREHGGPIQHAAEYFTDPVAQQLYQQRLRYIVARWGYSTSVLCWEFWNEVNGVEEYDPAAVAAWHRTMGDFLAQIDPYGHLRSTSFWLVGGEPQIDSLPEIDLVQTHAYNRPDYATFVASEQQQKEHYHKPHWIGEYGIEDPGKNGLQLSRALADPHGIHMHNGAWASLMSGCAGTAMTWYWDEVVDPLYLYPVFHPVAEFVKDLHLNRESWKPVQVLGLRLAAPGKAADLPQVDIHGAAVSWDPSPQNKPVRVALGHDGIVQSASLVSGILHGLGVHHDLHNPIQFDLDYPEDGSFGVNVEGVSGYGGARLVVTLDGKPAIDQAFPDTNPAGQHEILKQYNRVYSVEIPAGKHTLQVSSEGADWILVSYTARSNFTPQAPDVVVTGRQYGDQAILWLRNRTYTWLDQARGNGAAPQPAGILDLSGFRNGHYRVRWMNTHTGAWTGETIASSKAGVLSISTPAIDTDVSAKVDRE